MSDILITGHRKSGTSLLRNFLDVQDGRVYPVDIKVFYMALDPYRYSGGEKLDIGVLKRRLIETIRWSLRENVVPLRRHEICAAIDVIEACIDHSDERLDDPVEVLRIIKFGWQQAFGLEGPFIFKETTALDLYFRLKLSGQSVETVCVIRHPLDVIAAILSGSETRYMPIGEDSIASLASCIFRLKYDLELIRASLPDPAIAIVKYEDLVSDTSASIGKLLDEKQSLASLRKDGLIEKPTLFGNPIGANSHDVSFAGEKSVFSANVGRWRERLNPDVAAFAWLYLKDVASTFGYDAELDLGHQNALKISDLYKKINQKFFYHDSLGFESV